MVGEQAADALTRGLLGSQQALEAGVDTSAPGRASARGFAARAGAGARSLRRARGCHGHEADEHEHVADAEADVGLHDLVAELAQEASGPVQRVADSSSSLPRVAGNESENAIGAAWAGLHRVAERAFGDDVEITAVSLTQRVSAPSDPVAAASSARGHATALRLEAVEAAAGGGIRSTRRRRPPARRQPLPAATGGGRAAARAAGSPLGVPRVARHAPGDRLGERPQPDLGHRRLADHDRARVAQPRTISALAALAIAPVPRLVTSPSMSISSLTAIGTPSRAVPAARPARRRWRPPPATRVRVDRTERVQLAVELSIRRAGRSRPARGPRPRRADELRLADTPSKATLWSRSSASTSQACSQNGPRPVSWAVMTVEDPLLLRVEIALARILAAAQSPDETYGAALAAIGEALGCEFGSVWEVDPAADGGLRLLRPDLGDVERRRGVRGRQRGSLTLAPGEGLRAACGRSGAPAWINDAPTAGKFPRADAARRAGLGRRSRSAAQLRRGGGRDRALRAGAARAR